MSRPPGSTRVAIIGGGPAGSAAALGLRRLGVAVTLIEGRSFPRMKVCGEFISPAATALLEAVIPRRELLALGAREVREFVLEVGLRRRVWPTPTPAWALGRGTLDAALLAKAADAGADVLHPATVRAVDYAPDAIHLRLADGRDIDAGCVIHADGSGRHDPAGPTPLAPGLIGHKCHLRAPPGTVRGVTIRSCAGAYVGTIGIEGGLATCALVASEALTRRFGGDADALLASLWTGYHASWRHGEWKACGVARSGYVRPGHPRSLRIGNAAAAVDPVGGEGIGLALWSAAALVQAWDECRGDVGAVERRLASAYARRLRTRLPACRAAAWCLSRPGLVRAAWPLLALDRLTLRPWYALTGKPVA